MTREEAHHGSASAVVPVFFLSDSTGISAETMNNALLIQFPDLRWEESLRRSACGRIDICRTSRTALGASESPWRTP